MTSERAEWLKNLKTGDQAYYVGFGLVRTDLVTVKVTPKQIMAGSDRFDRDGTASYGRVLIPPTKEAKTEYLAVLNWHKQVESVKARIDERLTPDQLARILAIVEETNTNA